MTASFSPFLLDISKHGDGFPFDGKEMAPASGFSPDKARSLFPSFFFPPFSKLYRSDKRSADFGPTRRNSPPRWCPFFFSFFLDEFFLFPSRGRNTSYRFSFFMATFVFPRQLHEIRQPGFLLSPRSGQGRAADLPFPPFFSLFFLGQNLGRAELSIFTGKHPLPSFSFSPFPFVQHGRAFFLPSDGGENKRFPAPLFSFLPFPSCPT